MSNLFQDLRYAWRMLLRSRSFTAVAIFALALGIGASTAIFSVVNAVLIRPLPYKSPESLVMVWATFPHEGLNGAGLSEPEFMDLRLQSRVFSDVSAVLASKINLTGVSDPERLPILYTSASFFRILGVSPVLGRAYSPEEDSPGSGDVVVLSHDLWQQRFRGAADVLGKKIQLNEKSYTVLGVMPKGFTFGDTTAELWLPIALDPAHLADRSQHYLSMLGRLTPHVTPEQAKSEMKILAQRLSEQYPNSYAMSDWTLDLISLEEQMVGGVRPALLMLLGAVVFVLLIACANVANLLLARAVAREREVVIRSAIGAGRSRLFRQMITESLLLALLGGLAGLGLALVSTHLLISIGNGQIPRLGELSADWRVLTFTIVTSLATGLIFGVIPALQSNRTSLNDVLREGAPTSGVRRARLRSTLVVAELAIALMLLIGAGLLIKSFLSLRKIDPGFNAQNVLSVQLILPRTRYPEEYQQTSFFQRIVSEVKTLPGVVSVGAVSQLPLSEDYWSSQVLAEGKILNTATNHPSTEVDWRTVTPDYFRAMGIPLRAGRAFTESDNKDSQMVAVIDERFAHRVWPDESPIGKRIQEGSMTEKKPWLTIVGVVGNVKHYGLTTDARELVYLPQVQRATPYRAMSLVVRTSVSPETLIVPIRSKVLAIDPDQPLSRIKTLDQLLAQSIAKPRFYLTILGAFSAVALLLATIGIYGMIAYAVSQRHHELGVRMALGADRRDVVRLIVGQGLGLTLLGLFIGLLCSFAGTRMLASLLYGVSTSDPIIFVLVPILLGSVALFASYMPARRATRVDPVVALRRQ
jgi:putative ABC transport system permease protein